ncbi:MAG: hypothetical protein ACI9NC_002345 [Verrucomicrobiales bacterium]|jgi:hypothetical protein
MSWSIARTSGVVLVSLSMDQRARSLCDFRLCGAQLGPGKRDVFSARFLYGQRICLLG